MKKINYRFIYGIQLFMLIVINTTNAQISEDEVRADIQTLVNAPHGFSYFSYFSGEYVARVLEKMKINPGPYLAVIQEELVLPADKDSLNNPDFERYYSNLTEILKEIGNEEARDILKQAYFETVVRLKTLNSEWSAAIENSAPQDEIFLIDKARGSVNSLQIDIIHRFLHLNDKSILSDCLNRIENQDYSLQSRMLDYFSVVGIGNPSVISRLNVLYYDENSSLYNDQVLKNVINIVGSQLDPIAFVDELISFKHQAYDSLWIDNQGIVNSLDAKLDNVKKHLNEGQTKQAINVLNAFLNEVEAQKDKHIKRKAYVFLKYNAEYLIEKLSEE